MKRAYNLLAWLALVLAFLFPAAARADEQADAPPDAPLMITGIELSPLPSGFVTTHVGDWLTVAYPKGMESRVSEMTSIADEYKTELEGRFAQRILSHIELRLARDAEEMAELSPKNAPPFDYATAMAYGSLHLMVISNVEPRTKEGTNLEQTFRHELVHLALEDAVGSHRVPRWFNEGLAVNFSGENSLDRQTSLMNAELSGKVVPLSEAFNSTNSVDVAYAESADFVRFLLRDEDRGRFASLISRTRDGQAFEGSLGDAYSSDMRRLEYQWRLDLSHRFSVIPAITGGSALWVIAAGVLVIAWIKRKRKAKQTLIRWEAEEAAAEARARAIATMPAAEEISSSVVVRTVEVPRVEVDGDWHTLH